MRHLIALAAVAAAVSVAPATSYASGYCTGQVDTNCRAWVCDHNCFQRDCAVWSTFPACPCCASSGRPEGSSSRNYLPGRGDMRVQSDSQRCSRPRRLRANLPAPEEFWWTSSDSRPFWSSSRAP